MAEFKPLEHVVATMIREFNGGSSKHRTASDLAKAIIAEVRKDAHGIGLVRHAVSDVLTNGGMS